jgi:hypothetical protein
MSREMVDVRWVALWTRAASDRQSEDETRRILVSVSHQCPNVRFLTTRGVEGVCGNTLKGETLRLAGEVALPSCAICLTVSHPRSCLAVAPG